MRSVGRMRDRVLADACVCAAECVCEWALNLWARWSAVALLFYPTVGRTSATTSDEGWAGSPEARCWASACECSLECGCLPGLPYSGPDLGDDF